MKIAPGIKAFGLAPDPSKATVIPSKPVPLLSQKRGQSSQLFQELKIAL
jgi:hypothetical protein